MTPPRTTVARFASLVAVLAAIAACERSSGTAPVLAMDPPSPVPSPPPPPPAREVEGLTLAVVNHAPQPAPAAAVESARRALAGAGCVVVEGLQADLLLLCRERPVTVPSRSPPAPGFFIRSTSLLSGDAAHRGPATRWLAVIAIDYERWAGTETGRLREISIRVGTEGLDGPRFRRSDLRALWRVLEDWAERAETGR